MKSTLLAMVLFLAATTACSSRRAYVNVGYGGGYYAPAPAMVYGPPPPPRYVSYRPRCPGPGYIWVSGYWHPAGRSYQWRAGRWVRPPRAGMVWVAPRYSRRSYYGGYWRR